MPRAVKPQRPVMLRLSGLQLSARRALVADSRNRQKRLADIVLAVKPHIPRLPGEDEKRWFNRASNIVYNDMEVLGLAGRLKRSADSVTTHETAIKADKAREMKLADKTRAETAEALNVSKYRVSQLRGITSVAVPMKERIQRAKERKKEAIKLAKAGETPEEIALAVGLKPGVVRVHLRKAGLIESAEQEARRIAERRKYAARLLRQGVKPQYVVNRLMRWYKISIATAGLDVRKAGEAPRR